MAYEARDPMTGAPLTPPPDIEVESFKCLHPLDQTIEGMPHHDLVVFLHRLLVERSILHEKLSDTRPRPAPQATRHLFCITHDAHTCDRCRFACPGCFESYEKWIARPGGRQE